MQKYCWQLEGRRYKLTRQRRNTKVPGSACVVTQGWCAVLRRACRAPCCPQQTTQAAEQQSRDLDVSAEPAGESDADATAGAGAGGGRSLSKKALSAVGTLAGTLVYGLDAQLPKFEQAAAELVHPLFEQLKTQVCAGSSLGGMLVGHGMFQGANRGHCMCKSARRAGFNLVGPVFPCGMHAVNWHMMCVWTDSCARVCILCAVWCSGLGPCACRPPRRH